MSSTCSLWLLVSFIVCCADCKFQVHPKITFAEKKELYFSGNHFIRWNPGHQTSLYSIYDAWQIKVVFNIEGISKDETFEVHLKYKCFTPGAEAVQKFKLPLSENSAKDHTISEICNDYLLTSFQDFSTRWLTNTSLELYFPIKFEPRKSKNNVLFTETLQRHLRLQFEFVGAHWKLESNALYVQNLRPMFNFPGEYVHGSNFHFLTKEGGRLLLNTTFDSYSGFDTIQFIHPDFSYAIRTASDFMRAMLAVGAVLLINIPKRDEVMNARCDLRDGIGLISTRSPFNYYVENLKLSQLDSLTGKLTYSRYGIADMAHKRAIANTRKDEIKICFLVIYANSVAEKHEYTAEFEVSSSGLYPGVGRRPVPVDECTLQQPGPRNETVFARNMETAIQCPIICSNPNQAYRFYKDDMPLIPNTDDPDKPWTKINGMEVHKSSAILRSTSETTLDDAGKYRCTAGGKEAVVYVEVVALPDFSYYAKDLVGGAPPPRIFAPIGGSYTVSCTVFHFGMRLVSLWPEFYVIVDKRNRTWTRLKGDDFLERLKYFDSTGSIHVSRTVSSTTVTLWIRNVPHTSGVFDFSHRFVCKATVSKEDLQRFGVPDYGVERGSDVIVVPPPQPAEIESTMSPCCVDGCFGKDCMLIFSLKPNVVQEMDSFGVGTRGTFATDGAKLDKASEKQVTYNKSTGTLTYNVGTGVKDMSEEEKKKIFGLVPVFEYIVPSNTASTVIPPRSGDVGDSIRPCISVAFCSLSPASSGSANFAVGPALFNVSVEVKSGNSPRPGDTLTIQKTIAGGLTGEQNSSINSLLNDLSNSATYNLWSPVVAACLVSVTVACQFWSLD